MRINDISVSRNHCQISFMGQKFYLREGKSKFGTLVRMDEEEVLDRQRVVKVQMGRTVY